MNALETYIDEFCALARSRPRAERELREDWVGDYHIDTCAVDDREWSYETAIECRWFNRGNWVVVRGYETKEEAEAGHSTWCEKAKTGFQKIYDVYEERIYCKEKTEKPKQIKTIGYYASCKLTCPLCETKVEVHVPILESDARNSHCPICQNLLVLSDATVVGETNTNGITRMMGIR